MISASWSAAPVLVRPVAVGGLEQQHVGRRHRFGVAQDRPVVAAEVAGVDQAGGVCAIDVQLHRRRPQNVAGAPQQRARSAQHRERHVVVPRLHQPERRLRVVARVQRQRGVVLGVAAPVGALRFFLLQVGGVGQDDFEQIGGAGGAVDGTAKPLAREQRQVSRVVHVNVAQDHGVDRVRIGNALLPVANP